ncbi:MAG: LicD family protein [Clostridia bacterium]|nr:LicD family protein [Clostridia bacterium]
MLDEQIGLLTLLKEFDSICKKHNITYFLEGGSLLGAVRHKGFLPWDDDVDLCITRAEWKKLLAVIDEDLPAGREIYCYERYPQYLRETVKYTNLNSTVLFPNHILDGLAAGQHIDLFILDPAPSDPKELEEFTMLATVYSELMTPVYVMCPDILQYREEYDKYRRLMKVKGREAVLQSIRDKLYSYEDNEDCTTYYLRWGNKHRFFDKSIFGTPVEVEFEGGFYPAPQQYHRFLRAEFGDTWMMVPQASQQEDHSTYDCYHVPCKDFIADYAPFIDYKEMRKAYIARKKHNIRKLAYTRYQAEKHAQMLHVLYDVALKPLTAALSPEAEALLAQDRHHELAALLSPYCEAQLNGELREHKLAIPVCKEVLYAAAVSLVMVGRYWEAERIIAVHEGDAAVYTPHIAQLAQLVADIRACALACEEQRYADATALADTWLSRYPLQRNLATFKIEQDLREGADPAALLARTDALLARYPDSDELMYLMGRLHALLGDDDTALDWYTRCAAVTRNGLIMMELPVEATQSPEAPEEEIPDEEE